jgi:hypothetical protein
MPDRIDFFKEYTWTCMAVIQGLRLIVSTVHVPRGHKRVGERDRTKRTIQRRVTNVLHRSLVAAFAFLVVALSAFALTLSTSPVVLGITYNFLD